MENSVRVPPPPGWGDDPLSKYIQEATNNTYATFHNVKGWYNRLKEIDAFFKDANQNMDGTQDWLAAFFLGQAHSAYLAGVRLALSTHVFGAYMVLRGALECALYGLYITQKTPTVEIWLNRNENEETKKRVRDEFKISNMFQELKSKDQKLCKGAKKLYERTIDYGGHPNPQAFLSLMEQQSDALQLACLTDDPDVIKLCLKSCAQIGVCALLIFRLVFRGKFDHLGISQNLDKIKEDL